MNPHLPIASVPDPAGLPRRRGGPTDPAHDADLRRGVIATEIARPVAALLTVVFLLLVYAIPLLQAWREKERGETVAFLDLFHHTPTRDHLRQFEDEIEQGSDAKDAVQPSVQEALTRFGRVGNKKAVVGRERWLYYQPGVLHVGGPGFLEAETLRARAAEGLDTGDARHPDPRPAILSFRDALARRGIALVVFPVPDKAALQPRELHGRTGAAGRALPPAQNLDWGRFVAEMTADGVAVFDPTPPALPPGEPA